MRSEPVRLRFGIFDWIDDNRDLSLAEIYEQRLQMLEYADAAGPETQLWRTDSAHMGGYDFDPEEYERRVTAFFDDALLNLG